MNNKTFTKISISVIAVLLIAVLAVAMSSALGAEQMSVVSAATEETLMYASYNGTNGQITDDAAVDGHYTKSQLAAQLGLSDVNSLLTITNGQMLYDYLNNSGSYSSYQYAYLANDVAIAFSGINKSGYSTVSVHSSNSVFTKYLDGNGYKVSIEAGSGNGSFANPGDNTGDNGGTHWYTGYLCAVNQGTIKNLTIDFSSNHIITQSASNPNALYVPQNSGVVASAGIVTGLNKGTIDNIRLNVNGVFNFYMKPGGDRKLYQNTGYVGGIAGAMTAGILSNSQVNIASDGGIEVFVEGQRATWPTDHWNTASAAGGMVGKLQNGSAKVEYCALTGGGRIYACSNTSHGDVTKISFAGGAIATSSNINGDVTFDSAVVNEGQIKGIISSWTGTREDNWGGNYKSVKGLLFDFVGKNVQSCAVLYNLNLLTKSNGGTEYSTLDSAGQIDNWTEIYPSSTGGTMSVRYDNSTVLYDIRIEAVADGHDDEKEAISDFDMSTTGTAYHKYFMPEGSTGKIIWSGVFDKNGSLTDHINMDVDKPIYAEIYMLKSTDYGKFNYTFGTMGNITYTDNGNYVNGKNTKGYEGVGGALSLPTANFVGGDKQPTEDYTWEVYRDGYATDIEQSYMPGTYSMRTAVKLGTNTYGYFSETDRMIAWQSKTDYTFTITQGVFSYDEANTTSSTGWEKEFKFTLKMDRADDFDIMRYQQNGVFASEQIDVPDTDNSATFITRQGTGKNGMQYTFYAYKFDEILQDYVVVAVSSSKTVKIDNEAPEIYDVRYFTENAEGVRTEVTEAILNSWQKEKVIVTFTVTENGKSGLQTVASDNNTYISNEIVDEKNMYNVTLTLTDDKAHSLTYTDVVGNSTTFEMKALVDLNAGSLDVRTSGYSTYYGTYDQDGFNLMNSAQIGNSGWTLYVSDSVDGDGNPVWKEMGEVVNGDFTNEVDWNIGDYETYSPADFRVKMVNNEGLYEDVYANGTADGFVGKFCVYMKMADFYIDISLDAVVDKAGNSLKDLLAGDPDYFNKVYDSTQAYKGPELEIDLTRSGYVMVNTDAYNATVVIPDFSTIKLVLEYERASIGSTNIRMWAVLEGDNDYKFDVWFADLSGDYQKNAEAINKVAAAITKLSVTVNLADYLNAQYFYGDDIPTYVDANITADEVARIDLITNAKKGAGVGTYAVEGKIHTANDSIDVTIINTSIQIVALPVFVDLRYDGSTNIPTKIQFDGLTHAITATYKDAITGETKNATVDYTFVEDNKVMSGFTKIGKFNYKISTGDANYVVDGMDTFEMTVTKGFVNIEMKVVNVDYTGNNNTYDLGLTEEQKKYFAEGDITINYYKYNDGAYYDSVKKEMVGSYDLNPTTNTSQRGYYKVEVVVRENDYFLGQTYGKDAGELGLIIVNIAKTEITGESVVFNYDDQKHTYDVVKGKIEVKATADEKVLWDSSMPTEGAIVVKYYDEATSSYVEVDKSEDKLGGWFMDVDSYSFRVEYVGTENYASCSIDVTMVIDKAVFQNVTFAGVSGVYNAEAYKVTEVIPDEYKTSSTISYYYNGRAYNSLEDIYALGACVNVGNYRITLRMSKDNYVPLNIEATVSITNAKLNITANALVATYDGTAHYLTFNGLEFRDGNYYYMDHGKEVNALISGTVSATDAGVYGGNITIFVNNYEAFDLQTYIEIYPMALTADSANITLPNKLPSGVSVSKYYGTYTIDGVEKTGDLLYYTKSAETGNLTLVKPDANGVLPDGVYTVYIEVDNNHYLQNTWELKVGQINESNIGLVGWIVIGVVGALMIAAIITSIVTVKKRKQRGTV